MVMFVWCTVACRRRCTCTVPKVQPKESIEGTLTIPGLPKSTSTSSGRTVFLQHVILSNDFEKDVFQRRFFDGIFFKVALRGKDVEKVGERHVATVATAAVPIPIADADSTATTATFADRYFESRGDIVGKTCARDATHEDLGSSHVFPRGARKVDLIRGIPRGEFLSGANGCLRAR